MKINIKGGNMYIYKCKVTKLIDGDTLEVVTDLGFSVYHKIRVRLRGVDAPEIRGKSKYLGKHVSHHVAKFLTERQVAKVQTFKNKKSFDRWIGVIFDKNGKELNVEIQEIVNQSKESFTNGTFIK